MLREESLMWSEEEMRDLEPKATVRRSGASRAASLRAEVSGLNLLRARGRPHELTRGSLPGVIYGPESGGHGNFIDASYRRILARGEWSRRLRKPHTAKRQARPMGTQDEVRAWCELDAATSSDALLMNVFCYPRVLGPGMRALLGVEQGCVAEFGYKPRMALERGLVDRTEIDMKLGRLLVEAKLTENDFQFAPLRLLERYPGFDDIFDRDALEVTRRGVRSYQLIRGVLAAEVENGLFCVIADSRRTDLTEDWCAIIRAVRSFSLQARLRLVIWQEVAGVVPKALREFMRTKFGIEPDGSR